MLRLGPAEAVVFQSGRCTGPARPVHEERLHVLDGPAGHAAGAPSELAVLVRSIRNAAVLSDVAAPHRPWLPPLPVVLDGGVPAGAIGLVDVPAAQRRDALRWAPADGNLALIGSFGAGTTTALMAVLATVFGAGRDHVYVLDGRGDHRLDALGAAARTAVAWSALTSSSGWAVCSIGSSTSSTAGGAPVGGPVSPAWSSESMACRRCGRCSTGQRAAGGGSSCNGSSPRVPPPVSRAC